jgi:hypothetical protein
MKCMDERTLPVDECDATGCGGMCNARHDHSHPAALLLTVIDDRHSILLEQGQQQRFIARIVFSMPRSCKLRPTVTFAASRKAMKLLWTIRTRA